jgi:hypothetical protein
MYPSSKKPTEAKKEVMKNIKRTQAEMRFAAIEKRQREVLTERVQAADKVRKKTAKLKALRLLREAEDMQTK